jgi:2-succinyl-6-hydroxy-2,4-cyclohexadiene-1-carboxylate synthase
MKLPHTEIGSGEPSLTFVHGFTQTRASWHTVVSLLKDHFRCVTLDAPHHGEAQSVDVDFDTASDLIAETASGSILVGYSMGGRMALSAAIRHSAPLRGLILVSTTAGIADDAERLERTRSDETLAQRIESIGTAAFLEEWTAQPMFTETSVDAEDLKARLTNSPASLARSLRSCGTGAQSSLWDQLPSLQLPTLVITGARDVKYGELGRRLQESISDSELVVIDNAGHAVHLDQPSQVADVIADFVSRRIVA